MLIVRRGDVLVALFARAAVVGDVVGEVRHLPREAALFVVEPGFVGLEDLHRHWFGDAVRAAEERDAAADQREGCKSRKGSGGEASDRPAWAKWQAKQRRLPNGRSSLVVSWF